MEEEQSVTVAVPPFLEKLQQLVKECDPDLGHWSEDGKEFVVCSDDFEDKVLKKYFKGSLRTFIRQLHFYCFKKSEAIGETWTFCHPKFQRDKPELVSEIKRKTRMNSASFVTKAELESVKRSIADLNRKVDNELLSVNSQLANIFHMLSSVTQTMDEPTMNHREITDISHSSSEPKRNYNTSDSPNSNSNNDIETSNQIAANARAHNGVVQNPHKTYRATNSSSAPTQVYSSAATQMMPPQVQAQPSMQPWGMQGSPYGWPGYMYPGYYPPGFQGMGYPMNTASGSQHRERRRKKHSKKRRRDQVRTKSESSESQSSEASYSHSNSHSSSTGGLPIDDYSFRTFGHQAPQPQINNGQIGLTLNPTATQPKRKSNGQDK